MGRMDVELDFLREKYTGCAVQINHLLLNGWGVQAVVVGAEVAAIDTARTSIFSLEDAEAGVVGTAVESATVCRS